MFVRMSEYFLVTERLFFTRGNVGLTDVRFNTECFHETHVSNISYNTVVYFEIDVLGINKICKYYRKCWNTFVNLPL